MYYKFNSGTNHSELDHIPPNKGLILYKTACISDASHKSGSKATCTSHQMARNLGVSNNSLSSGSSSLQLPN